MCHKTNRPHGKDKASYDRKTYGGKKILCGRLRNPSPRARCLFQKSSTQNACFPISLRETKAFQFPIQDDFLIGPPPHNITICLFRPILEGGKGLLCGRLHWDVSHVKLTGKIGSEKSTLFSKWWSSSHMSHVKHWDVSHVMLHVTVVVCGLLTSESPGKIRSEKSTLSSKWWSSSHMLPISIYIHVYA